MGKHRKIKIIFVSERRADYSRFKPIMELIKKDPVFDYKLINDVV